MKPVFFSAPERCVSRDDALVGRLVELWEASVRATHDFLSEEDIRGIRTYVPDALRSIADLRIVRDAEEVPVAFMGCDGRRLEMLFVDPACRGAGVGTVLVREAFAAGVTEVVVNEQNPSARGFYEHVGFAVCGRSERDEQGGPFPILYMKLNDNNKPNMEKAIAKDLLSIGAVFLRPEQPFTWASGIKSPIYCDNRLTLTAPEVRKHVEAGLAEIVRTMPLDRIVLETDCPYLTPAPYRGQRNESAYVRLICDKIAELKGLAAETVAAATTANAEALFGIRYTEKNTERR